MRKISPLCAGMLAALLLLTSFSTAELLAQVRTQMPSPRGKQKPGSQELVLHKERPLLPRYWELTWKSPGPGLPGGLPSAAELDALPMVSVLDHGADPEGRKACDRAFNIALKSLPEGGGVLYVPAGTYRLEKTLLIGRSGVVVRGAGSPWDANGDPRPEEQVTRIVSVAPGTSIHFRGSSESSYQDLPNGMKHGDRGVTVSDGSAFSAGAFAGLDIANDPELQYTKKEWDQPWSKRMVGQLFEVESIHDDFVVFRGHANIAFPAEKDARITPLKLLRGCGIEKLHIEKQAPGGGSPASGQDPGFDTRSGFSSTIAFSYTAYCWVRDIESKMTRNQHIHVEKSIGLEVRDSYMHRSWFYGGGGSAYGVELGGHSTSCLAENNVFDSLRHALMVQMGANGNVFGYNYSANPLQGNTEADPLNQGWTPPDLSIHGHYPFMNLFEGNELAEIGIGDHWGPAGPGNVYFRNRVYDEGIWYNDASHHQYVIGNLATRFISFDGREIIKTEHGNVINLEQQWHPDIPDRELPVSLYLDAPPQGFLLNASNEQQEVNGLSGDPALPWPLFGPDVNTRLPRQNKPVSGGVESMYGAAPEPPAVLAAKNRYLNIIKHYKP